MVTDIIQPLMWAGEQKGGPDSPMVCGACPDWQECESLGTCGRASDEDYKLSRAALGKYQNETAGIPADVLSDPL